MLVGTQDTVTAVMVGGGGVMVTVAVPAFVASAVEVAFTVAMPEFDTVAGAVYNPVVETVLESTDQAQRSCSCRLQSPSPSIGWSGWFARSPECRTL